MSEDQVKYGNKLCNHCLNGDCIGKGSIGGFEIFNQLTTEEIHILMENKRHIHFKPGEIIFKQNTPLTHLVCIRKGLAKVVAESTKGKNQILQLLPDHSIFTGGGDLVNDYRHFTVAAITEVECCFVDTHRLLQVLTQNSLFSIEFFKHTSNQHLKMLNTLIDLSNKYMPGRAAGTLLFLKNSIFEQNPFQFLLTKQELAELSGMTKESFIRTLKEFEDSGLIRQNRNSIEILKENELTEISKNG